MTKCSHARSPCTRHDPKMAVGAIATNLSPPPPSRSSALRYCNSPDYVEDGDGEVPKISRCIHTSHGNNCGVTNHQALSRVQLQREHHLLFGPTHGNVGRERQRGAWVICGALLVRPNGGIGTGDSYVSPPFSSFQEKSHRDHHVNTEGNTQ